MGKTTNVIFPIVIALVHMGIAALFQWDTFGLTYSRAQYEKMYAESQYVLGQKSTSAIGDGDIYVYSGINYVEGQDPTSINFEHPPLGKYLFGLSYILFGYPNVILVPLFVIVVMCFWYLSAIIFPELSYRLVSLGLFLVHSTVFKEAGRTMLDMPQTAFLLLTTSAFCALLKKPSYGRVVLFGIASGMLVSVKYAFPVVGVYFVLLLISALIHRLSKTKIIIAVTISVAVYLGTYSNFFLTGHSLLDFIKFEWWRWKWYQGKTDNPKGLIFEVIFFGKYKKWWDNSGEYVIFPHWNILWPVSLILYVLSWFQKNIDYKHVLFPYKIWIVIALVAYSLGAYEDRFLLPLIPGFILFGMQWVKFIVKKWDNR